MYRQPNGSEPGGIWSIAERGVDSASAPTRQKGDNVKRIVIVSLITAIAVAAVGAVAPSAFAGTVLCSEESSACPAESTYPAGTTIEAQLQSATSVVFSGVLTEKCSSSTLAGRSTGEVGAAVPVELTGMTLSCSSPCKTVKAVGLPYSAEAVATESGDGTLTVGEAGEETPAVSFSNCSFGTSCTYSLSGVSLNVEGGSAANLVAKSAQLNRIEGMALFCGKSVKLSASYEVSTPAPLFVTTGEGRDYALCQKDVALCSGGDVFSAGTEIQGTAVNPIVTFGVGPQKCSSSTMTTETSEAEGKPLNAVVSALTFSGSCTPCTKATAKSTPYGASFTAGDGGNGDMVVGGFAIEWSGCTGGATCVFEFSNARFVFTGGSPASLAATEIEGRLGSGNSQLCGSSMKLTATWDVTTPSGVWLTRGA